MIADSTINRTDELSLSLIRGDWFFRFQQKLGLVPPGGLGLVRRALFWSMLSWLPMIAWAFLTGEKYNSLFGEESFPGQMAIHVRSLIAVPLFVLAEGAMHLATRRMLPYLYGSGLVRDEEKKVFRDVLVRVKNIRNHYGPWLVILMLTIAKAFFPLPEKEWHEFAWSRGEIVEVISFLDFGTFWQLYVSRSIFWLLLLAWIWRLILLGILLKSLARLHLSLIPTHPDRVGGLGFIEQVPKAFAPVVFGLSAVVAAKWAHFVLVHHQSVLDFRNLMIGLIIALLLVFLAPYLMLTRVLLRTRRQALLDYSHLVGMHGRLVRRKWILKEQIEDEQILRSEELGPLTDVKDIYQAVRDMRSILPGKKTVSTLLIPALIPQLILLSVQIPIKEILMTLLETLG